MKSHSANNWFNQKSITCGFVDAMSEQWQRAFQDWLRVTVKIVWV
jgi:hypothetical protein